MIYICLRPSYVGEESLPRVGFATVLSGGMEQGEVSPCLG